MEVERRVLLTGVPDGAEVLKVVDIDDRYLDGTRVRLRRQLEGLVLMLAEAKFAFPADAAAFRPAAFCVAEVSGDRRFSGGSLVHATREHVAAWTAEYGVRL